MGQSLHKVLVKTAAQAVHELVDEPCPDVRIGMIYTLLPAGRDLDLESHVHLVMTKGGLKDGEWVEIARRLPSRLAVK